MGNTVMCITKESTEVIYMISMIYRQIFSLIILYEGITRFTTSL